MLTKKFLKQIESYLRKNLKKPNNKKSLFKTVYNGLVFRGAAITNGHVCIDYYSRDESKKILERWKQEKKTFPQHLLNFIAERGINEVDICKKVHLDRRILSKLRNKHDYRPRKQTVIKIALALELNLDETKILLRRGHYTFSKFNKNEVLLSFFFENQIYDLTLLNEVLNHYGFKPLN